MTFLQSDNLVENEDQIRELEIYQRHYVQNTMVFETKISSVEVTIQDVNQGQGGAICKSINDPHTTTFDGQ